MIKHSVRNKDGSLSFFKNYLEIYEKLLWDMVQNGQTKEVLESKILSNPEFYDHNIFDNRL